MEKRSLKKREGLHARVPLTKTEIGHSKGQENSNRERGI